MVIGPISGVEHDQNTSYRVPEAIMGAHSLIILNLISSDANSSKPEQSHHSEIWIKCLAGSRPFLKERNGNPPKLT